MEQQLWPGWETVRVIGSGGFGKVYEIRKAEESQTGEYHSALKVIPIPPSEDEYRVYEDNGYDQESITRILQDQVQNIVSEFQMMSQFRGTSHIVSYEDHKIVPGADGRGWDILIRMELLTPLPEYYNRHGMDVEDTIKLGHDICRALELCGKANIIHRDIKPQNIFVNKFGDFKLGDFGIAKSMDHTTHATKIGTYTYMAPEVYRNQPYGASVDIYSLGLVMYWLLNERRLPFLPLPPAVPTGSQNEEAQARRLKGEALPLPRHGRAALQAAVLTACAADPGKRFPSPAAFREALEDCRRKTASPMGETVHPTDATEAILTSSPDPGRTSAVISPPSPNPGRTEAILSPSPDPVRTSAIISPPDPGRTSAILPGEEPFRAPPRETPAEEKRGDTGCPWCGRTGREPILYMKSAQKHWAFSRPCPECGGTGNLPPGGAEALWERIREERRKLSLPEGQTCDPLCPCCHGKGFLREGDKRSQQLSLRPCPRCGGMEVSHMNGVRKNKAAAMLLLCTIGVFTGAHWFYERRFGLGALQLLVSLFFLTCLPLWGISRGFPLLVLLGLSVWGFVQTLLRPDYYLMAKGAAIRDWERDA